MSIGPVPDLVIPVRFDMSKIPGQLSQVGAAGQAAGQKTAQGFKQAQQSVDGMSGSILNLMRAQTALSVVKAAAGAIANEYKQTQQSLEAMGKAFIQLRQSMQQVATLKGVPVTTEFTLKEARAAAKDMMTPEDRRAAQEAFLNEAGSMIGKGPGARLTQEQAEDFSSRMAVMMAASGFKAAPAMVLGGAMLQQKKPGPQNVDQLMREFMPTFAVAERGRVPLDKASQDIAELMSMGLTSEQAATMYSVVAPAAPGGEAAATVGAMRAIREMRQKGTAGEFGITGKMGPYEAAKAFGVNIAGRRQALLAKGMDEQEAANELEKMLGQKQIAVDVREAKGLIGGVSRIGTELGGFKTFEDIARQTAPGFEATKRKEYADSETGVWARVQAERIVAEHEREGASEATIELWRERARKSLLVGGRIRKPTAADYLAGNIPFFGEGTEKAQVNREMLRMASQEAGVAEPTAGVSSRVTDERMRTLLGMIEANTARAAAQAAKPPVLAVPAGLPANGARPGN
jgi:hypothetical protein